MQPKNVKPKGSFINDVRFFGTIYFNPNEGTVMIDDIISIGSLKSFITFEYFQ